MRSMSAVLSLILAGALSACAAPRPAVKEGASAAKGPPREMAALLTDLGEQMKALEKFIEEKRGGPARETLSGLSGTLKELGRARPAKGEELLQQYAEAASGMLVNVERSVKHSHWGEARTALEQAKAIAEDIRRDYDPGWWPRFKYRMKRL